MSLRDLINRLDSIGSTTVTLNEAQDYSAMFNDFRNAVTSALPEINYESEYGKQINDVIRKTRLALKRNDRIVWMLRFYKIGLMLNMNIDHEAFARVLSKNITTITSHGTQESSIRVGAVDAYRNFDATIAKLEHYLSLPIPAIQNTQWAWQSPMELSRSFDNAERKWKEEQDQFIDHDPNNFDGEVIMKFPDGFMWVNLQREYCDKEGAAMGHCGNRASWREGDRVLSLRKIVEANGKQMIRPSLTFILHKNGYLGEMKGRGNNKPDRKYHPHIIALLKSNLINGIDGGGYKPENNFRLSDLTDEQATELTRLNPNLADSSMLYKVYGLNEKTIERVKYEWDHEWQVGRPFLGFTPDGKYLKYVEYNDISDLIKRKGNGTAQWCVSVLTGDEFLTMDTGESLAEIASYMYDALPHRVQRTIVDYLKNSYPTEVEEWEEDHEEEIEYAENSDLIEFIESVDSDLFESLWQSFDDGMRFSAEREILDSIVDAIRNYEDDEDFTADVYPVVLFGKDYSPELMFDVSVFICVPTKGFFDLVGKYEREEDSIEILFENLESIEIKVDEPHGGFGNGYNTTTALESFFDREPRFK